MMMDSPADEAQRRAELLVSQWHARNRMYLGQGGGIDWQARHALIVDVAAAIAGPLAEVACLKEDAAPSKSATVAPAVAAKPIKAK